VLLFVIEIIVEYFLIDAGFLGLVVPDVFVTLRWTIGAVIGSVNRGGLLVEDSLQSTASPSSHPGDGFEDLSELASVDAGSERGVSDEYSPDVFDAGGSIEVDGGEGETCCDPTGSVTRLDDAIAVPCCSALHNGRPLRGQPSRGRDTGGISG
jgi:hypothetical protein